MPAPKSVYTLEKKNLSIQSKKVHQKVCNPPDINIQLSLVGGGVEIDMLELFSPSLSHPHIDLPSVLYIYVYIYQ